MGIGFQAVLRTRPELNANGNLLHDTGNGAVLLPAIFVRFVPFCGD